MKRVIQPGVHVSGFSETKKTERRANLIDSFGSNAPISLHHGRETREKNLTEKLQRHKILK